MTKRAIRNGSKACHTIANILALIQFCAHPLALLDAPACQPGLSWSNSLGAAPDAVVQRAHLPSAPRTAALPTKSCDLDALDHGRAGPARGPGAGPTGTEGLRWLGLAVLRPAGRAGPTRPRRLRRRLGCFGESGGGTGYYKGSYPTPKRIWPIGPLLDILPHCRSQGVPVRGWGRAQRRQRSAGRRGHETADGDQTRLHGQHLIPKLRFIQRFLFSRESRNFLA